MAEVIVRSTAGEQRFPLSASTVSIGRERFNDIVVADPKASRKHAQVEKIGEQWMITDLGSSNGTFMRGERISQVLIHEGDTVTIGAVSLSFLGVEAAPSDDLAPTTMASADELRARMARAQEQAQVQTRPTPPVAPPVAPPPPAAQGMETVDLQSLSGADGGPVQTPFADERTVDLAAMRASNAPPPPPPRKATDPEDHGTVAIMADQRKKGVSLQQVAPTAPPPMPRPNFAASSGGASGLPPMGAAPFRPGAPGGNPPSGARSPDALLQGGFEVNWQAYLQRGWDAFKANAVMLIVMVLLVAGAAVVLGGVLAIVLGLRRDQLGMMSGGFSPAMLAGMMVKRIVATTVTQVCVTPLAIALFIAARNAIRGRAVGFDAVSEGLRHFVPILIYGLVTSTAIALGLFLCLLPGLFLLITFNRPLAMYLIMDRGMPFTDAMAAAFKITMKNWVGFFLFFLILFFLNVAGLLACGVGVLVTAPVSLCAMAAMYDELVGFQG